MFTSVLKSRMLKTVTIALFLSLAFHQVSDGADHIIPSQEGMEEYFWTYGCTPTATSMVLSYWDNNYYYGRLIEYYYDNWCGDRYWWTHNVPNTVDELRQCMATDWNLSTCSGAGKTPYENITPGIECVTNWVHGYSFSFGQCKCGPAIEECQYYLVDWCWGEMKAEIDAGNPFVWSTSDVSEGHSVPAWGYRDDKYIILYDTWSPAGREDWYYSYYRGNSSDLIVFTQVNKIYRAGLPILIYNWMIQMGGRPYLPITLTQSGGISGVRQLIMLTSTIQQMEE